MSASPLTWIILASLVFGPIALRLISAGLDRSRIRRVIAATGGEVRDIAWKPFGRGWLIFHGERIYGVTFRNRLGQMVKADCRTSAFCGVDWMEGNNPNFISIAPPGSAVLDCLSCGAFIPEDGNSCTACGWRIKGMPADASLASLLEAGWTPCLECDQLVPPDGSACKHCGSKGGLVQSLAKRLKTAFSGLVTIAVGGFILWSRVILPFQTGIQRERHGIVLRDNSPVQFWIETAVYSFSFLIIAGLGIAIVVAGLTGKTKLVSVGPGRRARKGTPF